MSERAQAKMPTAMAMTPVRPWPTSFQTARSAARPPRVRSPETEPGNWQGSTRRNT
jgi:hypothetical protein